VVSFQRDGFVLLSSPDFEAYTCYCS